MLKSLRKTFLYTQQQDINLAGIIKYVADLGAGLKFLGATASPIFILLNIKLLFSRNALICLSLFIPALLLNPSIEVVRLMCSISILWIFFTKFKANSSSSSISNAMLITSILYALLLFSGIFDSNNYFLMGNGEMRYKFILESHNALCIPALIAFIFLTNGILPQNNKDKLLQSSSFIALILLTIVLLLVKSRLYIGLSLSLIAGIGVINWRKSWLPLIATAIYILLFLTMAKTFELFESLNSNFSKMANSDRALSMHATGRDKLAHTFYELVSEKGWQQFIFQNNVISYTEKKKAIPGLKMSDSTLTESSYFITVLNAGFLGLSAIIITSICILMNFGKRKEYFSILYFILMIAVWYFEETVLFPLSLIAQFFALLTINMVEKNRHNESRINS